MPASSFFARRDEPVLAEIPVPAGLSWCYTRHPHRRLRTGHARFDPAGLVPARFRVLILLAAFTSLRYGELATLERRDFDSRHGTLTVRAALVERQDGSLIFGLSKIQAGPRTVTIPTAIRRDVRIHTRHFAADDSDALIFSGATGNTLAPRAAASLADLMARMGTAPREPR